MRDAGRSARTGAGTDGSDPAAQRSLFEDASWHEQPERNRLGPASDRRARPPQRQQLSPQKPGPLPSTALPAPVPQQGVVAPAASPGSQASDLLPGGPCVTAVPGTAAAHPIRLQGQLVAYRLRRTRRRSIGFTVGADGLTVAAPRWVGTAQIEAALHDKAGWVLRKLADQRERAARLQAARIDWRDGATLPFLGRTVRLVLDAGVHGVMLDAAGAAVAGSLPADPATAAAFAADPAGAATAPLAAGTAAGDGTDLPALRIGLPAGAGAVQIRDAVRGWLQRQARRIFEERCAHYAPRLGVRLRRLSLSSARTRWGSASIDGSVRLNWRLVHFPLPTIDYVVAHELAHLRHMDHSAQFWAVVGSVVPDVAHARGTLRRALLPAFDN